MPLSLDTNQSYASYQWLWKDVTERRYEEWRMGSEERVMENGKWRMGNEKWRIGNGKWRTGNGKWRVGDGKLEMVNGERRWEN